MASHWVPDAVDPAVIVDVGANIGMASIYFADRFPSASIYAFEPMPEAVILCYTIGDHESIFSKGPCAFH